MSGSPHSQQRVLKTLLRQRRSWNDLLDIIEHSMMAVDALAMTAMTSNIARSNKQLDTVFADTIHDIELMDNEYASKRSRLSA